MGHSKKIHNIIQKIAIMLAIILAFPQTSFARDLGMGYIEAHADPLDPYVYLGGLMFERTLEVTPGFFLDPDAAVPGGTVKYSYQVVDADYVEYLDESAWSSTIEKSVTEPFEYQIGADDEGKTLVLRYVYSGDDIYAGYSNVENGYYIYYELCPCEITSDPIVTRDGNSYTLTFTRNCVMCEASYYFYLLTPADSSEKLSSQELVNTVNNLLESEGDSNNTFFGTDEIELDYESEEQTVTVEIDGTDFDEKFWYLQVVVCDYSNSTNYSAKKDSNVFRTPMTFTEQDLSASVSGNFIYKNEALVPTVTLSSKDTTTTRGAFVDTWITSAISDTNKPISFKFKQVKDYNGLSIEGSKSESINAPGTYEIYASGTYDDCTIADVSLGELTVNRDKVNPSAVIVNSTANGKEKSVLISGNVMDYADYGAPTGTLKYEYSIDELNWLLIAENKGIGNDHAFTWSVPETAQNMSFLIRATYSGDSNYNSFTSEPGLLDLEAPSLGIISDVAKEGDTYSFNIQINNSELAQINCYALLAGYDAEVDRSDIINDGNLVPAILLEDGIYSVNIDGSDYTSGIYVYHVVLEDLNGNQSTNVVTNPFITTIILTDDDISALADDMAYSGMEQTPVVELSINNDSNIEKALITERLNTAIQNNEITFTFNRIKDAAGNDISNETASSTVKKAGVYEINILSTDDDIVLNTVCIGKVTVVRSDVDVPDTAAVLSASVSDDFTHYVVTADISGVNNASGKAIEYSFNGGKYGSDNTYITDANKTVTVSIRFAATDDSLASAPVVSEEFKTGGVSAVPELPQTGSFSTDTTTIVINGKNDTDKIYYTLDGTDPTYSSDNGVGSVNVEIGSTTTVRAFAVESGKIKSDIVFETYSYVEAPDSAAVLTSTVSDDYTKYMVTADVSGVKNAAGKTIEFSFNGGDYTLDNTYAADPDETVTVSMRFAKTDDLVESAPVVSGEFTTGGAALAPILPESGSFSTASTTIVINGNNDTDIIYYTVDGTEPTYLSDNGVGSVNIEIGSSTTIKAFAVESGKVRSDVVTRVYNRDKTNPAKVTLSCKESVVERTVAISTQVDGVTGYGDPSGSIKYEYSIDETNWTAMDEAKGLSEQFIWSVPDALTDKMIKIRAVYSGDDNYNTAISEPCYADFEAPVISEISKVVRTDTNYSFTVKIGNSERTDGLRYHYLLSAQNENGYSETEEDIITGSGCMGEGMLLGNQAESGTEMKADIDGSKFPQGAYVFQVVVEDANGNVSKKVVSEYFMTPTILTASEIEAYVEKAVTYDGSEQSPGVTVSVKETETAEDGKEALKDWLKAAVSNNKVQYTFRRIKDGNGNALTKDEAASASVTEAGTYEIFASVDDADITIANEAIGAFVVGKMDVDEPDDIPEFVVSLTDDKTKYVVEVDSLFLLNGNADNVEYGFIVGEQGDDYKEEYTKEKSCIVEKGQKVRVKIRYASTNNTNTSTAVSSETIVMEDASSAPSITASGTFTDTMTVTIAGKGNEDEIYYTTDGSMPTVKSAKGIGVVKLLVDSTVTVRAIMSEGGKVLSNDVSATYTKSKNEEGNGNNQEGNGNNQEVIIDTNVGTTIVSVNGISANIKNATLIVTDTDKESLSLKATLTPSDASNKAVKWKVSPEGIVELKSNTSRSGEEITVTALSDGKVTITAESADNPKIYAVINLTVKYNHVHEWMFAGFDWSDPKSVTGFFKCKSGEEIADAVVTSTYKQVDEDTVAYTATILADPDGKALESPITESKYVIVTSDNKDDEEDANGIISAEFAEGKDEYVYTGSDIKPEVYLYNGNIKLVQGSDYTVSYSNNLNVSSKKNAKAKVTLKGLYKGTIELPFHIIPADISNVRVETPIIKNGMSDSKVKLTVTYNNKKLTQGKDFVIDWKNTTGPNSKGKRKIAIRGTGTKFDANSVKNITLTYQDKPKKIKVNLKIPRGAYVYDGQPVTLDRLIDDGYLTVDGVKDRSKIHATIEGNAIDAGKFTMYIFADGYNGVVKKNINIVPNTKVGIEVLNLDELAQGFTWEKKVTPEIMLAVKKDEKNLLAGTTLVLGRDYTIKYYKNTTPGIQTAYAKITFKGNYKGNLSLKKEKICFTIKQALLTENEVTIEMPKQVTYNERNSQAKSYYLKKNSNLFVTVNGIQLGTNDYTVEYLRDGKVLSDKAVVKSGDKIYVRITVSNSKAKYYGSEGVVSKEPYELVEVKDYDLSKARVTICSPYNGKTVNSFAYTGSPIVLGTSAEQAREKGYPAYISVIINGSQVEPRELDNMIITYRNNVDKGKAEMTITAKIDDKKYYGSKSIEFTIDVNSVKKVDLSTVSAIILDPRTNKEASIYATGEPVFLGLSQEEALSKEYQGYIYLSDGANQVIPYEKIKDLTYTYYDNAKLGDARLVISAEEGNILWKGSKTISFAIQEKKSIKIENIKIEAPQTVEYDPKAADVLDYFTGDNGITVLGNGEKLSEEVYDVKFFAADKIVGEDTVLSAGDNVDIKVTLKGEYVGEACTQMKVVPKNISENMFVVKDQPYTGDKIIAPISASDGWIKLIPDKDYTVKYSDNVDAGIAKASIKGIGNYTGTVELSFTIFISAGSDPMTAMMVIDKNTTDLHLVKGQTFYLDEGGWTSSDTGYVAVNEPGQVKAVKQTANGSVNIVSGTGRIIRVSVDDPKVLANNITLEAGDQGASNFVINDKELNVKWVSSNVDVASVSEDGIVKAISKGQAKITAYINGKEYSYNVKVIENTTPAEKTIHINVGKTVNLGIPGISKENSECLIDDETVATFDSESNIKAIKAGKTVITVKDELGKTYKVYLTVEDPTIANVNYTDGKYHVDLKVGESKAIKCNSVEGYVVFHYDEKIAYMDSLGVIHALKEGETTFTGMVNGSSIIIVVTVTQ